EPEASAEPEPEPAPEPEPEPEPEAGAAEPEPEPNAAEPEPEPETAAEPEPAPELEASLEPERDSDSNVVALFARLRETAEPESEPAADGDLADGPVPDSAFSRRDGALVPLIMADAKKLKRVLADEQNGVLDGLTGKAPVTSLDSLLPEAEAHGNSYTSAIE